MDRDDWQDEENRSVVYGEGPWSPLEVAVAMSLYGYNVSPLKRAEALYAHFDGACADLEDLVDVLCGPRAAYAVTELAQPTAFAYIENALARYGNEARARILANLP